MNLSIMSESRLNQLLGKISGSFDKTNEKSFLLYGSIGLGSSIGFAALCWGYSTYKSFSRQIIRNRSIDMDSKDRLGADEQNLHHIR
jgi:hypothetical protein